MQRDDVMNVLARWHIRIKPYNCSSPGGVWAEDQRNTVLSKRKTIPRVRTGWPLHNHIKPIIRDGSACSTGQADVVGRRSLTRSSTQKTTTHKPKNNMPIMCTV